MLAEKGAEDGFSSLKQKKCVPNRRVMERET